MSVATSEMDVISQSTLRTGEPTREKKGCCSFFCIFPLIAMMAGQGSHIFQSTKCVHLDDILPSSGLENMSGKLVILALVQKVYGGQCTWAAKAEYRGY